MIETPEPKDEWSKDFVEHLRGVHFALIALTTTMIVIVGGGRDRQIDKALEQITQIADLQDRWNEWQRSLYLRAARALNFPARDRIYGVFVESSMLWDKEESLNLIIDSKTFAEYADWKFSNVPMKESPRTISEFRNWWDQLHSGIRVNVPQQDDTHATCNAFVSKTDKHDRVLVPYKYGRDQKPDQCTYVMQSFWVRTVSAKVDEHEIRGALPNGDHSITVVAEEHSPAFWGADKPDIKEVSIRVEVHSTSRTAVLDETSLQELFEDWRRGSFDTAFRELANMPAEVKNVPIKVAAQRVADLRSTGEQTVEVLGLRIPAPELARWGTVLIVSVQFYFFIHCRELSRRVRPTTMGLDAAWIGVYRSRTAAGAVLTSACLLPVLALVTLGTHLIKEFNSMHDLDAMTTSIIGIMGVGVLVSALTARQFRSLRRIVVASKSS